MAACTVTFTVSELAISEAVVYRAFPFQIIDGAAISSHPIYATASGNTYTATLIQKAVYTIDSARYPFLNCSFIVPETSTANLVELLNSFRQG